MPDGDIKIAEDAAPSSQYAPSQYIIHGVSGLSSLFSSFGF
jgi:hypothetical protein